MGLGTLFAITAWILTDPDLELVQALPIGASTVATLIILLKSIFYVGMLHLSRKGLFDYLNLKQFFDEAKTSAQGAGLALIAVSVAMLAISVVMYAATTS